MNIEEKYSYCMQRFAETMPNPQTELSYNNPFELLVAVILSAQCTDKRVNMITPNLFKAFPTPKALSEASEEQIFNLIKSCSYPQNKAKHLKNMAIMLCFTVILIGLTTTSSRTNFYQNMIYG